MRNAMWSGFFTFKFFVLTRAYRKDSTVRDGHEQATVHAEQNAVSDAARRGVSLDGSIAYITHFPCINCAKLLISSGITTIKYLHDYHNDELVFELAAEANVAIERLGGDCADK